jgi:pyrroloquinoline quinone biosynthesis protein D
MIDASFVPKLAKKARLKFDRHESRWMILYPERGLNLNESAASIAQEMNGTRTVAEIVDVLTAKYGADARAAIETDVIAFVVELRDKGLLDG